MASLVTEFYSLYCHAVVRVYLESPTFRCFEKPFTYCSYHISNGCMCISSKRNNVNLHLAILSDECCTQVV